MITAYTRAGLMGLGDLGLVVPAGRLSGPEDALILGLGRKMQRSSVLLGATAPTLAPAAIRPASTAIAPRSFLTERIALPVAAPTQSSYTPPNYSPMPVIPAPVPTTSVPEPGAGMFPPRQISPSGSSMTWTQTALSPTPTKPPVVPPYIPARPTVAESPLNYEGESTGKMSWSPYVGRQTASPAGAQTALCPDCNPIVGNVQQNADGSLTNEAGQQIDPATGEPVNPYWQWVKDNKGTIGLVALAAAGVVVLVKVL